LTDGIQKKGAKIQPFQRLCRILTQKRVLNESLKDLKPEVKEFIKLVSERLKVESKKL
jgi:histone H3/H4